MLGIRPDYDKLIVDPCIPKSWDHFRVSRIWRGALYDIVVENPQHVSKGIETILVNGRQQQCIPALPAGEHAEVKVILG